MCFNWNHFTLIFPGGGIAVGSCLLVDEDKYSTYSSLILKYYLAEAVTNKHKVFLASANQPPSQIIQVGLHLHVYIAFHFVVIDLNQVPGKCLS